MLKWSFDCPYSPLSALPFERMAFSSIISTTDSRTLAGLSFIAALVSFVLRARTILSLSHRKLQGKAPSPVKEDEHSKHQMLSPSYNISRYRIMDIRLDNLTVKRLYREISHLHILRETFSEFILKVWDGIRRTWHVVAG